MARTSADGFLETGNEQNPDFPQLVFLGDSFVESLYAPETLRFTSIVERNLDDLGAAFACRNGGYSGSTTLNLLNVFINKVVPRVGAEDWVIFFVPQSDADSIMAPASYWSDSKRSSTIIPGFMPKKRLATEGIQTTESILRLTVMAARELGVNLVLASSPFASSEYNSDRVLQNTYRNEESFMRVRQVRHALHSTAQKVSTELKIPYINVEMPKEINSFYDQLHLNEQGQKLYADLLTIQLKSMLAI